MEKTKTYFDTLMEDKRFREKFDEEYQNICIGEQIARTRQQAGLSQTVLAERIHTTKSAISRYESARYSGYTVGLLHRIANACGADLMIGFASKKKKKISQHRSY